MHDTYTINQMAVVLMIITLYNVSFVSVSIYICATSFIMCFNFSGCRILGYNYITQQIFLEIIKKVMKKMYLCCIYDNFFYERFVSVSIYIHVQLVSSCVLIFQVDIDSLIRCREIAAQILKDKTMLPTGYKFKAWPKNKHCNALTRSRSFKRKVEHVEIEDDVYDGIKRLYSEEVSAMSMTCASEFGQDKEISSPFVQPAVCAN